MDNDTGRKIEVHLKHIAGAAQWVSVYAALLPLALAAVIVALWLVGK